MRFAFFVWLSVTKKILFQTVSFLGKAGGRKEAKAATWLKKVLSKRLLIKNFKNRIWTESFLLNTQDVLAFWHGQACSGIFGHILARSGSIRRRVLTNVDWRIYNDWWSARDPRFKTIQTKIKKRPGIANFLKSPVIEKYVCPFCYFLPCGFEP